MPTLAIHQLGVAELQQAFRGGETSPAAVCARLLERIADPAIHCNAFVQVDAAGAIAAARAATERHRRGEARGPLDGVPVAIKDVLDVAGLPTRYGSPALRDTAAAGADALAVSRLRAAGAVLLGKTRTWEFAWRARVDRDASEVVLNPRNPRHSAGGSSSGSAAAVAAGLCPLALGTDSGGSVRGPAAFCGIVGFKPSRGRVPVFPPGPMGPFEHIGVLARSVEDARLALEVLGGYAPEDPDSWPYRVSLARAAADPGARIGYSPDLGGSTPSAGTRRRFGEAVERLRAAGFAVAATDFGLPADFVLSERIFTPAAAASLALAPAARRHLVDPEIVALARAAERLSAHDYLAAAAVCADTARRLNRLFESIDFLLTPTQEASAHRLDEPARPMRLARPFNVTGQPALSLPAGVDADGLPMGVQLVGRRGEEAELLAMAALLAPVLAS